MAVDVDAVRKEVEPVRSAQSDGAAWRLFATGFSFVVYGIGGLIVSCVCLPILYLLLGEKSLRPARRLIQLSQRLFVGLMHRAGALTYEVRGIEKLGRPGQLILANHPSLIDVVFLLAFTPQATCSTKHSMWRNPFTSGAVRVARYISNRSAGELIEGACSALERGDTLIMFPEGTRTVPNRPMAFHRSAANIALRSARAVTPVYIDCNPTTLTKGQPWYAIPPRRFRFTVMVGEDIDVASYRALRSLPIASRALNDDLKAHFEARLDEIYCRHAVGHEPLSGPAG